MLVNDIYRHGADAPDAASGRIYAVNFHGNLYVTPSEGDWFEILLVTSLVGLFGAAIVKISNDSGPRD
jgi:hypothetical protein